MSKENDVFKQNDVSKKAKVLKKSYDLITMGRSCIDLYANDIGVPFEDITNFAAYVGGSPTNIAVGARRLSLEVALLSAIGQDKVGDFIVNFLKREGVETRYIPTKQGARSSAVLLGIEKDTFPLVFYRDNAADIQLSIEDVMATPLDKTKALEFAGTNLAKEPSRSATFVAAERAQTFGATVYMDIDFRVDQWHDPRAFGTNVRAILPRVDVAIGTEEEINAAMLRDPSDIEIKDQQISAPIIKGNIKKNIKALLAVPNGPEALVVKRGAKGATIHLRSGETINVPGFPVEIYNVLGAGDAFASGFIYGRTKGWDWYKAARMGNACGAIVVTRHGCANFMGYEKEVLEFMRSRGGF
ncbi:MAG: 5-dehydro-2-deoxygluconokinase [Trueperaceae bacterium]